MPIYCLTSNSRERGILSHQYSVNRQHMSCVDKLNKVSPTVIRVFRSSTVSSPIVMILSLTVDDDGILIVVLQRVVYSIKRLNSGCSTASNGWSQAATHSETSRVHVSWLKGSCWVKDVSRWLSDRTNNEWLTSAFMGRIGPETISFGMLLP